MLGKHNYKQVNVVLSHINILNNNTHITHFSKKKVHKAAYGAKLKNKPVTYLYHVAASITRGFKRYYLFIIFYLPFLPLRGPRNQISKRHVKPYVVMANVHIQGL